MHTYKEAMDYLFTTYQELWQPVWDYIVAKNPKPDGVSDMVYETAIRGRVCDNLRKLLPLGIKTNFGVHADFRTFSEIIMNMRASDVAECRDLADQMNTQLKEVNPEFISVTDNQHGKKWTEYERQKNKLVREFSKTKNRPRSLKPSVEVVIQNTNPILDLTKAALLTLDPSIKGKRLIALAKEKIKNGQLTKLIKNIESTRNNRRHKPPAFYNSVELTARLEGLSFASYKDFNRQRPVLWKSQPDWRGKGGIYIPEEIAEMGGETLQKYISAQEKAAVARKIIAKKHPIEARLLLTHGTRTSFALGMGLGQSVWIEEIRSMPSGDPEYRWYAQELHVMRGKELPELAHVGSFTDMENYTLNRIREAQRADTEGKTGR